MNISGKNNTQRQLLTVHDRGHIIGLTIEINGVGINLGYNGAALRGNIWMNTHAGNVHPVGMARTLVHELAHNWGQVYADKNTDATFGRPPSKNSWCAVSKSSTRRICIR
ncbi:hypothetical protein CHISP_2906 [Chitinispirillum alkaliphilum]|nr:hypothetical protein CHISP_2906 [Chitinispirillum alkaliphilum]